LRLAEFKTRLFIFCAGRLLKWAELIEQKIDPQQLPPPADDSQTTVLAESSSEREAVSGPPEHWARLTNGGPPQHWLDVINQKSPHLLSSTGNELLSTGDSIDVSGRESFQTETNQEANSLSSGENAEVNASQPSLSERSGSRETKGFAVKAAKAGSRSWLNRLHFRRPTSSSGSGKPRYVSNSRRSGETASSVAGGAAEKGTEATPLHARPFAIEPRDEMSDSRADETPALRDRIVRLSRNLSNKAQRSDSFGFQQSNAKSPGLHRTRNQPQPQHSASTRSPQRSVNSLEPVNKADKDIRRNISHKRGESYVTNPRSRTSNESTEGRSRDSSAPKPNTGHKESDGFSLSSFSKREEESPSLRVIEQPAVERSAAKPAASFWRAQPGEARRAGEGATDAPPAKTRVSNHSSASTTGSFSPLVHSDANRRRASNEFASTDRAASGPNELKTEATENVWPSLPLPPVFELADELAAMEREAEGLQRLEHEQRGDPWNA
jgi:hypothetical protein